MSDDQLACDHMWWSIGQWSNVMGDVHRRFLLDGVHHSRRKSARKREFAARAHQSHDGKLMMWSKTLTQLLEYQIWLEGGLIKYFGNCNGQPYSGFPTHTCKRNLTRSTLEKPVHLTIKVHLKIHLASSHIFWVEIHLFLFQFFPKTVSIDCVGRDLSPIELYPVFSHLATNWALSSLFNSHEIFQWTRCHFSDNWAAGSSNHWHLSIQAFFLFFFKSITKLKNWFERTSKEVTRPADFS